MPADFVDLDRRKAKATAIAAWLRSTGITPADGVRLATDTKWLRSIERVAGVPKSSDATWALAFQDLGRRPPVQADQRRPGCRCTPNPHGVLYEFPGWPCPHGTADDPAPGYTELHEGGHRDPTDLVPGPPPTPAPAHVYDEPTDPDTVITEQETTALPYTNADGSASWWNP